MPIIPNFIERLILLRLNQGPGLMLDFFGALGFKAVSVAFNLGVFEALSGGPLTAAEAARQIKANERATTLLLEGLIALGYVKKQDGRYANTAMTVKWVLGSSPNSVSGLFGHAEDVLEMWGNLEESIRRGEPVIHAHEWADQHPGAWRDYQAAMVAIARMSADEIIAKVKLPPAARRLLDVGGGHGLYSIMFCHQYPRLSATVLDMPQAMEAARETIAAERMGDRVTFQEGDFWVDDLGSGYDTALLFNIIHANSSDKNTELFRKVASALNQGGLIVIMDQFTGRPSGSFAAAFAALQGLNQFINFNGQTYAPDEIAGWLTATGFTNTRHISLRKAPGIGLVVGTKTG